MRLCSAVFIADFKLPERLGEVIPDLVSRPSRTRPYDNAREGRPYLLETPNRQCIFRDNPHGLRAVGGRCHQSVLEENG